MLTRSRHPSIALALLLAIAGCENPVLVADAGGDPVDASEMRDGAGDPIDASETDDAGEMSDDAGEAPDAGTDGGPTFCVPGAVEPCYEGPAGTEDVGACTAGTRTCEADGSAFGACADQTTPMDEDCATAADDDCDGEVNEGCACTPGATAPCYSGPAGTMGIGLCASGTQTCEPDGSGFGACTGETLPATESCSTADDDDCDGMTNEGCAVAVSYATSVQPILQSRCASCHTTGGSGGANLATSYASTQLASSVCAGLTKGACMLVRIQNGSMPAGRGCTGNPAIDAANPSCVTAAEQATIQAWITGGQLP